MNATTPEPTKSFAPRRALATLFAAATLVPVLALSACAGDGNSEPSSTPETSIPSSSESGSAVTPPTLVDLDSANGTSVTAAVGKSVVLTSVAEPDPTVWMGDVADPSIAEWMPGRSDGSATFNPGLTPLAPGTTSVTVSRPGAEQPITFTLTVTG